MEEMDAYLAGMNAWADRNPWHRFLSLLLGAPASRHHDPELPTWGTGEWEWRGVLPFEQQPQAVNPSKGYVTSWNNKVAPGWRTADDDWGMYPALKPAVDAGARTQGSSFGYGWYGILVRDLRRVRGIDDGSAVAPISCGMGDLDSCRQALWSALGRVQIPKLPWTVGKRVWFLPYIFNFSTIRWSNKPAYVIAATF